MRALLGVLALVFAIASAIVPVVEARPKDKGGDKQDAVAEEKTPRDEADQTDDLYVGDTTPAEQSLTAGGTTGSTSERTLLDLDSDGDYIPDALDNCPNVQNPDQSDADADGNGDSCTAYQDLDGDTVPDKQDNCPNIATSDFSDRDGDGVGDSCDKSPDGIEPDPEPVPELEGQRAEAEAEALVSEDGQNLNGKEVERDGRSRTIRRERTHVSKPVITTGADAESEGIGGPPAQDAEVYEEPVRDDPRINEELIAEAAASGELFAPPEPPPAPQRAWDEEATVDAVAWDPIVKIDSGVTTDAEPAGQPLADSEPSDAEPRDAQGDGEDQEELDQLDNDVADNEFARGWVRAKQLLQEELPDDEQESGDAESDRESSDDPAPDDIRGGAAPVPVENGLVLTASRNDENSASENDRSSESGEGREEREAADEAMTEDDAELLDQDPELLDEEPTSQIDRQEGAPRKDGSRRNGSSRGAAAVTPEQRQADVDTDASRQNTQRKERRDPRNRDTTVVAEGWSDDHYFEGGSALDWRGSYGVAGTDDPDLYLTQRSGAGRGKRRGFDYGIPVDVNGVYLVRLYFAEPYWGSPGGPSGDPGQRIFTVTAEGETILEDIDIFAEVGAMTALVKQEEVDVQDGELNLSFTAIEGEPIVAGIEILQPAQ